MSYVPTRVHRRLLKKTYAPAHGTGARGARVRELRRNLGAKLFSSSRMWKCQKGEYELLFAPDLPGLPVLVTPRVFKLLDRFNGGATVGEVLAARCDEGEFDFLISAIGFLEERGFLKPAPDPPAYEISAEDHERKPPEMTVWLHITNHCNLGCDYCFVQDKALASSDEFALDRTLASLASTITGNELRKATIKLAGGEPTLAMDIAERVYDYIHENVKATETEVRFAVLTNGTALNRRVLEFLGRPGVGVGISVDGCGAAHDAHRVFKGTRRGSWGLGLAPRGPAPGGGHPAYIMATLTPESMRGVDSLMEWLLTHDLTARLNVVRPYYGEDVTDTASPPVRERPGGAGHSRVQGGVPLRRAMAGAGRCHQSLQRVRAQLQLPAQRTGLRHRPQPRRDQLPGQLADCVMRLEEGTTEVGEDLLEDVRNTVGHTPCDPDSVRALQGCLRCQWFPVCGGGCPTYNARVNGYPFTQSPLCQFYKAVIPSYLECVAAQQVRIKEAADSFHVPDGEILTRCNTRRQTWRSCKRRSTL